MHRKMASLILAFLMIRSIALAIEWDPYTVYDASNLLPMSEHDVIAYRNSSASWITDGIIIKTVSLPGNTSVVWRFDGTCSLLCCQMTDRFKSDVSSFTILYWASSATDPITVYSSDEPCLSIKANENTVAVLREENGKQILSFLDGYGNQLEHVSIPENDGSAIENVRMIESHNYWVQIRNQDNTYSSLHIVDGQIMTAYRHEYRNTYSVGGAPYYICTQMGADSSYPDIAITELTDDQFQDSHYLYGDKVVLRVQFIEHTEDDGMIITGSAVANTRKVYRVFRMYVTRDWKLQSIDVRDSNFHGNYYPEITSVSKLNYCMVYMRSYDDLSVLPVRIPFDDLPVADNPGIGIR